MADIKTLLDTRDMVALRAQIAELSDPDVGDELVRLDPTEQGILFRLLPKDRAITVFETIAPVDQAKLLDALRSEEVVSLVEELDPDDRAHLLDEMPAKIASLLIERISPEERLRTAAILGYADETAGRMMTPEYVSVRSSATAGQALQRIRTAGIDAETIYVVYVVDATRQLVGAVSLKDLVLADPDERVEGIMTTKLVTAHTDEDQEEVAQRLADNDLLAIPVVDSEHRLVGIVTFDDAFWILQQEATEDVERIGGALPLDRPYLASGVFHVFRARILWLFVLLVAATLTGTILQTFEASLAEVVALSFFIPMLIGTGGNAGSQTATTIVRAMALGEVRSRDIGRVVFKELRVGLLLGAAMAVIGIARALTWDVGFRLGIVVALGLISVVVLATFVGSVLPIVVKRLRLDPAVVSAPLITTFVDATGLLLYFVYARLILGV